MVGARRLLYKSDRDWSDRYIPEIKTILGHALISVSTFEQDTQEATDLIVFDLRGGKLACRLRREQFLCYKDEFTIRASRPSGAKSELQKIAEGWGDLMFYGFAGSRGILMWWLFDLSVFRARYPFVERQRIKNRDGSSDFMVMKHADFGSRFYISKGA